MNAIPPLELHPDRLFPNETRTRGIARELYTQVKDLPIISPHGHTDPSWFAKNTHFDNAVNVFIKPDHYVFRMLYSQGIPLEALGITNTSTSEREDDLRKIWRLFSKHYYLYRGTPSRLWLDTVFYSIFKLKCSLNEYSADLYFDTINQALSQESFRPRALLDQFNIEVLATTENALDPLTHHIELNKIGWGKRVVTTYRPDTITDPDNEHFQHDLTELGEKTGEDTHTWQGYLAAHRYLRAKFKATGATASDHSHPSALSADLDLIACETLFEKIYRNTFTKNEAELFRAQMLTEMAGMSLEDGLVMQIHCGPKRNHNQDVFNKFGRDKGGDVPQAMEYVNALAPLLNKYGNEAALKIIIFTLDESTYTRELAPLAGHYPALKIGPAWWFYDSPEGMRRYRQSIIETAGFYNTVGFNDDTRAFFSIPARHDVARRMDCAFLSELVGDHRLSLNEANELATDLSYTLAKKAYNFD